MSSQTKFPLSVNLLTDRLNQEVKDLAIWNAILVSDSSTISGLRQAKGNIPSTENRIKELRSSLELLNSSS
jgi:hypothetical protein